MPLFPCYTRHPFILLLFNWKEFRMFLKLISNVVCFQSRYSRRRTVRSTSLSPPSTWESPCSPPTSLPCFSHTRCVFQLLFSHWPERDLFPNLLFLIGQRHGPNIYKDTNPLNVVFFKLTGKRYLATGVYLSEAPDPLPPTHCMNTCTLGCSDFDFFHILRYNHPSLTP